MVKNCQTCSEEFTGNSNQKHCKRIKIKLCRYKNCCNYYKYKCGLKHGTFCSISCQNYFISQETNANSKRSKTHQDNQELYRSNYIKSMEAKYGSGVNNPSQIPTVRDKRRQFLIDNPDHFSDGLKAKFGEEVVNISQVSEYKEKIRASNKITQNTIETKLKKLKNSYPYIKNAEEYLTLDFIEWAENYKNYNGVKPTPLDLQLYFNFMSPIKIPYEAKEFYNLKDSALEVYIQNILTTNFNLNINKDFYRRKRFLKNEITGRSLELDFFLPQYMLALEINDYSTHSKDSDIELNVFNKTKKGPTYSSRKIELASNYGINLFEIWEDELSYNNKGSLIEKIDYLLDEFKPTIEVVTIYNNNIKNGELLPLPKEFQE